MRETVNARRGLTIAAHRAGNAGVETENRKNDVYHTCRAWGGVNNIEPSSAVNGKVVQAPRASPCGREGFGPRDRTPCLAGAAAPD